MDFDNQRDNPADLSYEEMRKFVGIVAVSLPFVLALGAVLLDQIGPRPASPQPFPLGAISDYYYSRVGGVLVGSLCAIAAFLGCCRGYSRKDELAGYLAGFCALGVAFFPTTDPANASPTPIESYVGYAHEGFAALLFLTLAYFCFFLFKKTSPSKMPTPRKLKRNVVYTVCGWAIVICMAVMTSLHIPAIGDFLKPIDPLFWFETFSLLAFGIAWLTKGGVILRDV